MNYLDLGFCLKYTNCHYFRQKSLNKIRKLHKSFALIKSIGQLGISEALCIQIEQLFTECLNDFKSYLKNEGHSLRRTYQRARARCLLFFAVDKLQTSSRKFLKEHQNFSYYVTLW